MERYYTTNLTYTGAALPTNTACQRDLEAFYTFAVSAVTGSTYTLQATPQGPQTRDTECGTLRLDHRGERTVSGGADVAQCWQSCPARRHKRQKKRARSDASPFHLIWRPKLDSNQRPPD